MTTDRPKQRFFAVRRAEYRLLFLAIALAVFGVVMVHSASVNMAMEKFNDPNYYVKRQIIWFALGFVSLLVFQAIDYRIWQRLAAPLFFITLGLLILVLLFPAHGMVERSWTRLGFISFQTSEPAKLTFILFFSSWLARRRDSIKKFSTFLSFLVIMVLLTILIMKQPDFGTLSIIVAIAFTMYFVAGMAWQQLFSFIALVGASATYFIKIAPYRLARIMNFLNPQADTQGSGYHVRNILISVGSGSWWGLGLGNSRQKRLFLPEPHNDSIFAVITEELGFIRAGIILLAIFYFIWLTLRVAQDSEDDYGRYVVVGIGAWIFWQSVFNLGAMIGLLPLTGVPLPFISYGGSSLFVLMSAVGILLNISKWRRRYEKA